MIKPAIDNKLTLASLESSLKAGDVTGEGARVHGGGEFAATSTGASAPLEGLGSVALQKTINCKKTIVDYIQIIKSF